MQLEQAAVTDQQVFAGQVVGAGGTVETHYWVLSALAVDIPAALVPVLRAHPRVRRMVPVRARQAADAAPAGGSAVPAVPPPPILTSTDLNNHNVAGARAILTQHTNAQVARGLGAVVGFFDTGIDDDADGTTAGVQHHVWFTGPTNTTTRILAHIRAGTIDCNHLRVPGDFGPLLPGTFHAYRPGDDSTSALHGTAMAGIAVGRDPSNNDGHAPAASIVDVSVTVPPPADLIPPYDLGNEYKNRWTTNDARMLSAIQALRSFIATTAPVHVLNISFDGWSDPLDPVAVAFDEMAVADDVLLVTSCGNSADETFFSNGFYNGLAVGSVHTRVGPFGWGQPFAIMRETSRGPLSSNLQRYFPDVSATGAGFGTNYNAWFFNTSGFPNWNQAWLDLQLQMPMVDLLDPSALVGTGGFVPFGAPVRAGAVRFARGTSEAAAQVSGSAALYRAARLFLLPGVGATAQETRAAILISTIGGAQGDYVSGTQQAPGHSQTAYSSRNTVGVGYVRDDLLAEFAVRSVSNPIKAMHQSAQLSSQGQSQSIAYSGLTPGKRYVVAACWPRPVVDPDGTVGVIANVDLTIRVAGVTIARSWSTANSYERVAFVLPANVTAVDIDVQLLDAAPLVPLTVDVVAREFDPDRDPATPATVESMPMVAASGFYESLSPGTSCVGPARSLEPFRTVPSAYAGAYGSAMNQGLRMKDGTSGPWGTGLHIVLRSTQMGSSASIGGLAFRTWRPFTMIGGSQGMSVLGLRMENRPASPVNQAELDHAPTPGTNVIPQHPGGVLFGPGSNPNWVPFGFDEFPLVVPFDVPFPYTAGSNLHIWISFYGEVFVDGAKDTGSPEYGYAYNHTGGTFYGGGWCPILALLPAPPATLPNLTPRLRIFGEPLLGTGLEMQIVEAPANTLVALTFGTWAPNFVPGLCIQHITIPFYANYAVLNDAGMARWTITLPTDMPWLHSELLAMQGVVLGTPILFTNAMRAVLGGGL